MDDDLAHTIEVLALALQHDPLGRYFQLDIYGISNFHFIDYRQSRRWFSDLVTLLRREGAILAGLRDGGAVSVWLPPQMTNLAGSGSKDYSFLSSKSIADEEALAAEAKKRHLGTKPHWALALIDRHAAYTGLPVARRIILPFIEKARKDGHAVWLEASNPHAGDVYLDLVFALWRS